MITLLSDPHDTNSPYFTLSPLSIVLTTSPTPNVIIQLCPSDIDFIQYVAPRLLYSKENSFLSFLPGAFYDIANPPNQILVNYFRYGVPVSSFVSDLTPPKLLFWNFSYPAAELRLKFDKRVNCSTTNVTRFVLQSRSFMGTLQEYFHLSVSTNPALRKKLNSRVICDANEINIAHLTISLGLDDILQLKNFSYLAKSIESTFLRMLEGAVS